MFECRKWQPAGASHKFIPRERMTGLKHSEGEDEGRKNRDFFGRVLSSIPLAKTVPDCFAFGSVAAPKERQQTVKNTYIQNVHSHPKASQNKIVIFIAFPLDLRSKENNNNNTKPRKKSFKALCKTVPLFGITRSDLLCKQISIMLNIDE